MFMDRPFSRNVVFERKVDLCILNEAFDTLYTPFHKERDLNGHTSNSTPTRLS